MRLNRYIALATGMSRRAADTAVTQGRVQLNNAPAQSGQNVIDSDIVVLDGQIIAATAPTLTILLNKPVGYVCSRDGQGSQTIYDLLPASLHHLKPVGRLDKDSSGLLLLTNDGTLAHELTHPSFEKTKVYKIALSRPLSAEHLAEITGGGILLDGQPSVLGLARISDNDNHNWKVTMHEGRNRQIRRTFEARGYKVVKLHRTHFGNYRLEGLRPGKYKEIGDNNN